MRRWWNLYISSTTEDYKGLFGYIGENGKVCNLTISTSNAYTTSGVKGGSYVGLLAGCNKGTIENVKVSGLIVLENYGTKSAYKESVGGLVGCNRDSGKIEKSISSVSIVINTSASSTAGRYYQYIGGLVGKNSKGNIEKSTATGIVYGTATGDLYIGGLIGQTDNTKIENTYTISEVIGKEYIGGLVGKNDTAGTSVKNSYWTIEKSGCTRSAAGTVLEDMSIQSNYVDWDFDTIWHMENGYPKLNN